MENILGAHPGEMHWIDFFTSHEGLHLPYEQAQTRRVPRKEGWYNLSTHFPWIGMRTADPDGAHVEYFRGIVNPVAVKVGPSTSPESLKRLIDLLDPQGVPGRLTLIHRFGCERIAGCLPPLIEAARSTGKLVVWCCDPMHGNTETVAGGLKTRRFENILKELELSFRILRNLGAHLGGVHFELTGENVTECMGGASGVTEQDLPKHYRTNLDPRLNYEQALEMALLLARLMADNA
jgi:3-deoxy-7-phosphoheptulonate synthase